MRQDSAHAPFHEVHWELTNHCNLKCVHCYLAPDARRELTTLEIHSLLDQLQAEGFLWLTLSGGEPLLRRDFSEIYRYAHDRGFLINVFTNGTRIKPDVVDLFRKYAPHMVEITLNGITAETFERVTAVPGSFAECLSGIRSLHAAGTRLILKSNGMTINIHEILEVKRFAQSLPGVQFKFDSVLMPRRDHDLAPTKLRLKPAQLMALYEEDQAMKREIQEACGNVLDEPPLADKAFTCRAAKTKFHISAWGDLHPCSTVRPIRVSLREFPLKEAIPRLAEMVEAVEMPKESKCSGCKIFSQCASCPGLAHLERRSHVLPVEDHCESAHTLVRTYAPGIV